MSSKQWLCGKINESVLFGSPTGLSYGESTAIKSKPAIGNQTGGRKRRRQRGGANDIVYNERMVLQPRGPVLF